MGVNEISAVSPEATRGGGPGLLVRLFGLASQEAHFSKRGFAAGPAQPLLERIGESFIRGYNLALDGRREFPSALDGHPVFLRGFVAEGAAMGAAVRSALLPWRHDLGIMLAALNDRYVYLAHVGVGWAMARLPVARGRLWRALDPLLAPLAIDGWGFHDGYFHPRRAIGSGLSAREALRRGAYDQGVGRSLWFVHCADPARITDAISSANKSRSSDLWSGVGLAAAYAGGVEGRQLDVLATGAGPNRPWLAQGTAFGIEAHARAGAVPPHSSLAAVRLCGTSAASLSALVLSARDEALCRFGAAPAAYAAWRRNVAETLAAGGAG
ncbi:MAG TPA: DUF1702 family protein [Allosphingosinicella sp.]|jgi:hypothetical protein